jgi:hypothetical protein
VKHMSFALTTGRSFGYDASASFWSVLAMCRALWQFEQTSSHFEASRQIRSQSPQLSSFPTLVSLSLLTWSNSRAARCALKPQSMHLPPIASTRRCFIAARARRSRTERSSRLALFARCISRRFVFNRSACLRRQEFAVARTLAGLLRLQLSHDALFLSGLFRRHSAQRDTHSSRCAARHLRVAALAFSGLASRQRRILSVAAACFSSGGVIGGPNYRSDEA